MFHLSQQSWPKRAHDDISLTIFRSKMRKQMSQISRESEFFWTGSTLMGFKWICFSQNKCTHLLILCFQFQAEDFIQVHSGEDGEAGSGSTSQWSNQKQQLSLSNSLANFALILYWRNPKWCDFQTWPRGLCCCLMRCPGRENCLKRSIRLGPPAALEAPDRSQNLPFNLINLTTAPASHLLYLNVVSGISGLHSWCVRPDQPLAQQDQTACVRSHPCCKYIVWSLDGSIAS